MEIAYTKRFLKEFKKTPKRVQIAFKNRLEIFVEDPFSNILNNHKLIGRLSSCRSINITGDWRVIYRVIDEETVLFFNIGTHSKLYK